MDETPKDPSIVDLEIKITYLEETVQELNKVTFKQQRTIDLQETKIKQLTARLNTLEESSKSGNIPDEKPPHY